MKPYSVSFGGIPDKYSSWKSSAFVVLPFPIDLTATYVSGTRNGPRAMIEASELIMNLGASTSSLYQVIFSLGTAPE